MAVSKSTISPLRTPRDGAWPTPRILRVPSGRVSPTTTQTFHVPIPKLTNSKVPRAVFLSAPAKASPLSTLYSRNLKSRLQEAACPPPKQPEARFAFGQSPVFSRRKRFASATQDQRQSQIFRQQFLLFHQ